MPKTMYGEKGGQIESFPLENYLHSDERGWVLFPWDREEIAIDPKTIHVVETLPGAKRGNHRHPRAAEWLCPLEGEGILVWRSPSGELRELHLRSRGECVRIHPDVAHAVRNAGSGTFLLMAAREKDPEGDLSVPDTIV
mgnify:CR=1 FL=1